MTDHLDGTFNLKHRLVGAIVLIGVAVILLPRVLTGTDPIIDRSATYSSSPSPVTKSSDLIVEELAEYSEIEKSFNGKSIVGDTGTVIKIDPLLERNDPKELPSIKSSDNSPVASSQNTSTKINIPVLEAVVTGWISQVGVFEKIENADKLIVELKNDGISGQSETVSIEGRVVTRVWIGPFSSKDDALREGTKAMLRSNTPPVIKKWP
tara:strand:+ start:3020 stop:3646 length:627 start_codon:yes stop_codon:yes gene_type:complete